MREWKFKGNIRGRGIGEGRGLGDKGDWRGRPEF